MARKVKTTIWLEKKKKGSLERERKKKKKASGEGGMRRKKSKRNFEFTRRLTERHTHSKKKNGSEGFKCGFPGRKDQNEKNRG